MYAAHHQRSGWLRPSITTSDSIPNTGFGFRFLTPDILFMIFRGPFPQVSIPEMPLTEFVLARADALGDKPALIDGPTGRIITYSELARAIERAAAGLAQRGFKQGDVLGIISSNTPEYAICFHAVASLGGINTPINPLYTEHEIAHQLKDAGAKFL